ncbi:MAG: T9SS type A sorting domain-containing protein [Flavobacteriales bacterium]|nr:T9SS type A sorting domain-containing protein [Flavobacteriales bacterium]
MNKIIIGLFFCSICILSQGQRYIYIGSQTGASTSQNNQFLPTDFGNAKNQYHFLNADLVSAGLVPGDEILGIEWYVVTDGTPSTTTFDLYLDDDYAGATMPSSINFATINLNQVGSSLQDTGSYSGWHGVEFTSSFIWDGTDNMILQLCRSGGNQSGDDHIAIYNAAYDVMISGYVNNCSATSGLYTMQDRPYLRFKVAGSCINDHVHQNELTLTAEESGASYQWVACPSYTPLAGDTLQSFTTSVSGEYAVIITKNGCVDTSACYYAGSHVGLDLMGSGNNITTNYAFNVVNGFTIEYDFYMHSLQNFNAGVTATSNNVANPLDLYVTNTGNLSFFAGSPSSFQSTNVSGFNAGTWYHIAISHEASNDKTILYVDGIKRDSITISLSTNNSFSIGDRADGATNAEAKFDNVRIWSVTRTQEQINEYKSGCLTGNEAGLDILYTMQVSDTLIRDLALGNGAQDGMITGSVQWSSGVSGQKTSTISPTSCGAYTSPSGKVFTTSNTYLDTVSSANGCDSIININLTVSNVFANLVSTSNVNCNGDNDGSATVLGSGGVAPYTYLWPASAGGGTNSSVNFLAAGDYIVTVTDANNCSATDTVTITEPSAIVPIVSVTSNYNGNDISCPGASDGELSVSATGGIPGYTYIWQPGNTTTIVSGLSAGPWRVTVTDAFGCTAEGSDTLFDPSVITVFENVSICQGDSIFIGNNYQSTSGSYIDSLTTATYGCDSIVTVNLSIDTLNLNTAVSGTTITAVQTGGTYQWINCDNGNITSVGDTNISFTPSVSGNYAVLLTNGSCLIDTSACVNFIIVGILENNFDSEITLYPNPTERDIRVDLGNTRKVVTITITDVNGRIIQSVTHLESKSINLSISEPSGVYLMTLESEGQNAVIRVVKK